MEQKARKPLLEFSPLRVSDRQEIAEGVFMVRFPRTFSFRAGQVVALKLAEAEPHRLYSIASGEKEEEIGILFDVNPGGLLTPRLSRVQSGDTLWMSQPIGFFVDDDSPAWWIATGTGIAPFLAMFRSMDISAKTLIHGGRATDSFYFQEELSMAFGDAYIRCSSTAVAEGAYPGRLTAWLKERESLDPDLRYFLCGNAEMVVDVRDLLISRGVPFENVRAEIYF